MMALACLLSLLGCMALSLSKKRHRKEALPRYKNLSDSKVRCLLLSGFICQLVFAAILIESKGVALGLVYGFGWFSIAAFSQALLLSFRPRWTPPALVAIVLLAPLVLLAS